MSTPSAVLPHGMPPKAPKRSRAPPQISTAVGRRPVEAMRDVRALLILNVQNDFFEGGSFPVRGADAALRTINGLRAHKFDVVFVCSTHRPPNYIAYSSNNPGTRLHEAAILDVGPQIMWPDHCVEGTFGANFHEDLVIDPADVLTSTGHDPHTVVHSAFGAAHRQGSRSLLERLLRERKVTQLFLAGLTTDFAVLYTALDARYLLPHLQVYVIEDACASVSLSGAGDAHRKFACERVTMVTSTGDILASIPLRDGGVRGGFGDDDAAELQEDALADLGGRLDFLLHESKADAVQAAVEKAQTEADTRGLSAEAIVKAIAIGAVNDVRELVGNVSKRVLNTRIEPLGWTPLHVAAASGSADVVRLLLAKGANPGLAAKSDGSTPVLLAVRHGFLEVASVLLEYASGSATVADSSYGMTPLMCACQHADVDLISLLVSSVPAHQRRSYLGRTNRYGMTALMYVCAAAEADWVHQITPYRAERIGNDMDADDLGARDDDNAGGATHIGEQVVGGVADASAMHRNVVGVPNHKRAFHHNAAESVSELLAALDSAQDRLNLFRQRDKEGWSALHFAARSGLLARIDWALLDGVLETVPVNLTTRAGLTMLHLSVWNGHAASVAVLLGSWPGRRNPWRSRVQLDMPLSGRDHTELDLAIMRRHVDCARLLIRAGSFCRVFAGPMCEQLLHRLLLLGDGIAAELLLRNEANEVHVNKVLLSITRSMKYPDSCTFTFAGYHNPMCQHLYKCTVCDQTVCLVCSYKCHKTTPWRHSVEHQHELVYMGSVEGYCGCLKDTCRALASVDRREVEGYKYVPKPIVNKAAARGLDSRAQSHSSMTSHASGPSGALVDMPVAVENVARALHGASRGQPVPAHTVHLSEHTFDLSRQMQKDFDGLSNELVQSLKGHVANSFAAIASLGFRITKPSRRRSNMGVLGEDHLAAIPGSPAHFDFGDGDAEPLASPARQLSHIGAQSFHTVGSATTLDLRGGDAVPSPKFARPSQFNRDGSAGSHRFGQMLGPSSQATTPRGTGGLPPHLHELVGWLARNMHELWAQEQFQQGWRFAAVSAASESAGQSGQADLGRAHDSSEAQKTSELLVPFHLLTASERETAIRAARELLLAVLSCGLRVERHTLHNLTPEAAALIAEATASSGESSPERMRQRMAKLKFVKQGVYNAFLVVAACTGNTHIIPDLLVASGQTANINCADERARTPLYLAVQRLQLGVVEVLIQYGADLELADDVGVSPLSVAAYLGSTRLVALLLEHGASYTRRDRVGMTPIHYAAYAGNTGVVEMLARRLCLPSRPGVDFRIEQPKRLVSLLGPLRDGHGTPGPLLTPSGASNFVSTDPGRKRRRSSAQWATAVLGHLEQRRSTPKHGMDSVLMPPRGGTVVPLPAGADSETKTKPAGGTAVGAAAKAGSSGGRGKAPRTNVVQTHMGDPRIDVSDDFNADFTVSDLVTPSLHISQLLNPSSRNTFSTSDRSIRQSRVSTLKSLPEEKTTPHAPPNMFVMRNRRPLEKLQEDRAQQIQRCLTAVASEMSMGELLLIKEEGEDEDERAPPLGTRTSSRQSLKRVATDRVLKRLHSNSLLEDAVAVDSPRKTTQGDADSTVKHDDRHPSVPSLVNQGNLSLRSLVNTHLGGSFRSDTTPIEGDRDGVSAAQLSARSMDAARASGQGGASTGAGSTAGAGSGAGAGSTDGRERSSSTGRQQRAARRASTSHPPRHFRVPRRTASFGGAMFGVRSTARPRAQREAKRVAAPYSGLGGGERSLRKSDTKYTLWRLGGQLGQDLTGDSGVGSRATHAHPVRSSGSMGLKVDTSSHRSDMLKQTFSGMTVRARLADHDTLVRALNNSLAFQESHKQLLFDGNNKLQLATESRAQLYPSQRLHLVTMTPLSLAIHARRHEVVEVLLKSGADPIFVDGSGLSPHQRALLDHAKAVANLRATQDAKLHHTAPRLRRASTGGPPGDGGATPTSRGPRRRRRSSVAAVIGRLTRFASSAPDDDDEFVDPDDSGPQGEDLRHLRPQPSPWGYPTASTPQGRDAADGRNRWEQAQAALHIGALDRASNSGSPTTKARRATRRHLQYERFSDKLAAAAERHREQAVQVAQQEEELTSGLLLALSKSAKVQKQRQRFAWVTLARKVVSFIVVVVALAMITPLSSEYKSSTSAAFVQGVSRFAGASWNQVASGEEWWMWMDRHLLWLPPATTVSTYANGGTVGLPQQADKIVYATADYTAGTSATGAQVAVGPLTAAPVFQPISEAPTMPPLAQVDASHCVLLGENMVLGAIRVTVERRAWEPCTQLSEVGNAPRLCLGEVTDDMDAAAYLLSATNVTQRRAVSDQYRSGDDAWASRTTRRITMDTVLHNPHVGIFAALKFITTFHTTGIVESTLTVTPAFLFQDRFQPSLAFELVAGVLAAIQLFSVVFKLRRDGVSQFWKNSWSVYELVIGLLLCAAVAFDVYNQHRSDQLRIDMLATEQFVDMESVVMLLRAETDLLAILLVLVVLRLVKHLRFIPKWGPIMVAVLLTWQDTYVQLYLAVALGLTACFGVAFHVAFGAELPAYSSLPAAFKSLFDMGFTNDWNSLRLAAPRLLTTFFYIFYVLFAIVLINLFIGIVTDAFPKARRHSQEAWEKLITRMLEEHTQLQQAVQGMGWCQRWTLSLCWRGNRLRMVETLVETRGNRERADTSTLAAVAAVTLTMQPNNANNASERLKSSPGEASPSASLQHRHSGRTRGSIDRQTSQRSEGTLPRQQSLGMDASARALGSRHFPDAPATVGFPDAVDGGELPPYRPVLESQSSRWSRADAASGRWSVRNDVDARGGSSRGSWARPTDVADGNAMHGLDAHLRAQDQALTALTAQLATMQSALQDVSRRLRNDQ